MCCTPTCTWSSSMLSCGVPRAFMRRSVSAWLMSLRVRERGVGGGGGDGRTDGRRQGGREGGGGEGVFLCVGSKRSERAARPHASLMRSRVVTHVKVASYSEKSPLQHPLPPSCVPPPVGDPSPNLANTLQTLACGGRLRCGAAGEKDAQRNRTLQARPHSDEARAPSRPGHRQMKG